MPETLQFALNAAPVTFAASEDGGEKLPSFEMVAYTGTEMMMWSWSLGRHRVVLDLDSLDLTAKSRPILLEHDRSQIVGHTESISVKGNQVIAKGVLSGTGEAVEKVRATARNGFPWQASVGVSVGSLEEFKEGKSVKVNGREFAGPIYVARGGRMSEISFVVLGADDDTSAKVAAKAVGANMSQNDGGAASAPDVAATGAAVDPIGTMRAAAAAEQGRIAEVQAACAGFPDIAAKAIGEGWTVVQAKLAATERKLETLRAERPSAPGVYVPSAPDLNDRVLEASLLRCAKMVDSKGSGFDEKTLEASEKAHRHGLSLQELVIECANMAGAGVRGSFRTNARELMKAAFSNSNIAGILGNAVNKSIAKGFGIVESAWREIAEITPVKDFKSISSYRLTGDHEFEEVAGNGEIKSGTITEESYSNAAKTYAKLLTISRQDLINDDMGVLTTAPVRLGRGAALKLNKVFWAAFNDNSAFFTVGRANLLSGAGSALGSAGLAAAEAAFRGMLDDQGNPHGIEPAILLVPSGLDVTARQLYTSTEIRDTTASTKYATANVFAGLYRPVASQFVGLTALSGGAARWFLLADPMDMPVMQVVFLNGQDTPTIEQVEPDADMLGITLRGYFDFGCAKAEWRGGVRNNGS